MNPAPDYPLPFRRNLLIASVQLLTLPSILIGCAYVSTWWAVLLLALAYGIVMNSAYAMLHEAEHTLFHPNARLNHVAGAVIGLFFPAPYHLLRQGHLGHHMRNRSDDEAFDLYFEEDNVFWKHLQYYGILTGLFWLVVILSNLIALLYPRALTNRSGYQLSFDRPSEALIESLNPRYIGLIRLEALAVFLLHGSLIIGFGIPPMRYFLVLCGFGCMWSALQYLHHFDTIRDVRRGARNVRAFRWLDAVMLNHNLHLVHHMYPTVPWLYLTCMDEKDEDRKGMFRTYLRMWRGPRKTIERVKNHYAGKIIR